MASKRGIKGLYDWRETRFTSLSHGIKVYIYGADVTGWLKGDVSVTYGNRDSFNTASFELANPRKIWQLTRENLSGKWREGSHEYSEKAKQVIFIAKNSDFVNPFFELNTTKTILGSKKGSKAESYENLQRTGSKRLNPPLSSQERRWRLAVNDCIFGRNDPVRIFMKNPYSGNEGLDYKGEWMEVFCGFLQDHPITTNYATGESTCRINCTCIRNMLTKMRVQMNNLGNENLDPQPLFDEGFFSDFRDPSKGTHPFAATSLEATIKELILGTATPTVGESAQRSGGLGHGGGVGDFKLGNTVCFNPGTSGNLLERWHLMAMFGVNKVTFPTDASDDLWLTTEEMTRIGDNTIYYPDTYAQGPSGRYLHLLLPDKGTGAGSLCQATFDSSPPRGIDWTTRWDIIRDFAKALDFQVLTSPSGDILVEFPMYSFTPHIFSLSAFSPATKAGAASASALMQEKLGKGENPVGIGNFFVFEHHQMEDTLNDEAEDYPTVLQVDGGVANMLQPKDAKTPELDHIRAFVYSPVLVSRYGVISEQMSVPFAGQKASDAGGGANGVIAKRLPKLALIEYMKRLADSSTWDGSVAFRPFLFPNRPIWLKRSHRCGNLTSVTNRWTVGKNAGTSFSLNMLMSERFNPDDGKIEYRLPTGAANAPISYADLWKEDQIGTPESSVWTQVATNAEATKGAAANGAEGSTGSGKAPMAPTKISINDSQYMFPEFTQIIKEAMAIWQTEGKPEIAITSTYRSPAYQADMKRRQKEGDPKFQKFAVGEPWGSSHQYGLAVDIWIKGNKYEDYQEFYNYCNTRATLKNHIYWGDAYKRNGVGDYIHYEYKAAGMSTGLGQKANELRQKAKISDADANGTKHLKVVWDYLRSIESLPGAVYVMAPTALTEEEKKVITDASKPEPRALKSGMEAGKDAAPDCKAVFLNTPDLKNLGNKANVRAD